MEMKLHAITAKEAYKLAEKLGLCIGEDGRTYYATDEDESVLYEFDSKKRRDDNIG